MTVKERFLKHFGRFETCTDNDKWTKIKDDTFKMYLLKHGSYVDEEIELIDGDAEDYSINLKMKDFDDEMNVKEQSPFNSKITLTKIQRIINIIKIQELENIIKKDTKNLKTSKSTIKKF